MPDYFQNLGDPLALDGGASFGGGDPLAMQMPDPSGAIGSGITMPPQPPGAAAPPLAMGSPDQPVSGLPPMPMIAPPTTSQKLIAAGLAMIQADRAHLGLGGSLAAGMGAYNDVLTNSKNEAAKERMQQLAEYELMGRIQDRHQTQLAMQKKLEAGARIKTAFPELADLYDADPEAALKLVAEKQSPKTKFENVGGTLYKMEDGKDPVPYGIDGKPLPPPDPNAPDNTSLSGPEFLATLSPDRARYVKGLATGKYSLNKRSKSYQQDISDALHYDPSADEQTLKVREQTMKQFASTSSNTAGGQIIAANTGIGHGIQLMDLADKLGNKEGTTGATIYNWLKNKQQQSKGNNPAINDYLTLMGNFVDETGKFYKPGGDTLEEHRARVAPLDMDNGPTALKSAIKTQIGSYMSKLDELDHAYRQGVDPHAKKYEFLDDTSRKALLKLGYLDPSDFEDDAKTAKTAPVVTAPAAALPAPAAAAPPVAPAAIQPQAGDAGGILGTPAPALTQEQQLAYTAKKYGMTIEQVKKKLGIK